jgi:hypothetical protein
LFDYITSLSIHNIIAREINCSLLIFFLYHGHTPDAINEWMTTPKSQTMRESPSTRSPELITHLHVG